jgi:hypothetical protein
LLYKRIAVLEAGQGLGARLTFPKEVAGVRRQIIEAVQAAGGPADLDRRDPLTLAETEVEP